MKETWTITAKLTVFAGDMEEDNIISNAEDLLEKFLDGTDFMLVAITDAERNE